MNWIDVVNLPSGVIHPIKVLTSRDAKKYIHFQLKEPITINLFVYKLFASCIIICDIILIEILK